MILIDTNILSTFAKIRKLESLLKIFEGKRVCISCNVLEEIKQAVGLGYVYASPIINLSMSKKIEIIELTKEEYLLSLSFPKNFGKGERDSLAIAKKRSWVFITNEKRVLNYCNDENISAVSLNSLLRLLWEEKIQTKEQVKDIINEIETKDSLIIQSKKDIIEE
ncbi:hypothetical protein HY484_02945 [Candidatus Woesearchaeota archaeon]|nr:hypothetical protein [Candidatus Woesearchaeota archaeon]